MRGRVFTLSGPAHRRSYYSQPQGPRDTTGVPTDHWSRDVVTPTCASPACGTRFSMTERRHHCRNCGKVFCGRQTLIFSVLVLWFFVFCCSAAHLIRIYEAVYHCIFGNKRMIHHLFEYDQNRIKLSSQVCPKSHNLRILGDALYQTLQSSLSKLKSLSQQMTMYNCCDTS